MSLEDKLSMLQTNVVLITFKKKDGSIREMEATLVDYLLPEVTHPRPPNDEIITVFDLVSNGWRSIRLETIIDVEVLND